MPQSTLPCALAFINRERVLRVKNRVEWLLRFFFSLNMTINNPNGYISKGGAFGIHIPEARQGGRRNSDCSIRFPGFRQSSLVIQASSLRFIVLKGVAASSS